VNTQSVLKLARLAQEMADRLEKIGVDADGVLDPIDVSRIREIRKQIDKVLTRPVTKAIKKAGTR
jgi:hypothetical protein